MIERKPSSPEVLLPDLDDVRRIAVVHALHLGDFLATVPALRAVRTRFPEAEITLIALAENSPLAERLPYIDRFLGFPRYGGLEGMAWNLGAVDRLLDEAREYGYDLAIQMHGEDRVSNGFVARIEARVSLGYRPPDTRAPRQLTVELSHLAVRHNGDGTIYPPSPISQSLKWLRLVATFGAVGTPHLEFPLLPSDHAALDRLAGEVGLDLDAPIAVIHPGSRHLDRRWPFEKFAAAADCLAGLIKVQVVITGVDGERNLTRAVADRMHLPSFGLAGRTSVGTLAALLSKARVLISSDAGPVALAVALGTPSVVAFGPHGRSNWGALDRTCHRAVSAGAGRPVSEVPVGLVLKEALSVVRYSEARELGD